MTKKKIKKVKNYGFIKPVIDEEKDYILGALLSAPFEVVNELGDWTKSLPEGEPQKRGSVETYSCTNFGTLNVLEVLLKYLYQIDENYSERFMAIVSEQTPTGNDPQKVAEAIRKKGIIEESELPFTDSMSLEEYFAPKPMTRDYLDKAQKFLQDYEFKHEYIFTYKTLLAEKQKLLLQALKRSPVGVSVYAWVQNSQGLYFKPEGEQDTHWTVLVGAVEGQYWICYDSYTDEGSYIKKLTWDFDFGIAKGFYVKKKIINNLKDTNMSNEDVQPSVSPRSDLFSLNRRDWTNGLLVAVISAVLVYLKTILEQNGLALTADNFKEILSIALTTGLGYLVKNLFETPTGENKIVGGIKKMFKK